MELEQVLTYKVYTLKFSGESIFGYFATSKIADELLALLDNMDPNYFVVTLPTGEQYQYIFSLSKRELNTFYSTHEFVESKQGVHLSLQSVLNTYFKKRPNPKAPFY